ncbi:MAG TPA: hypothetical protein VNV88_08935 [Candidatus Solibacter sp.]|nr:hypothetical protein [Candidatus Solibacter sp.]
MKKTIARLLFAMLFVMTCGPTPLLADGSLPLPPYCPPDCICN